MRSADHRAFTLVEVLVVVVVLGILAAIVIVLVKPSGEDTRKSSLFTQLKIIRSSLQRYHLHHNSVYPTLAQLQANWDVITQKTLTDGTVDTNGEHGPYLKTPPINSFELSSTVEAVGGAGPAVGWIYDAISGNITGVVELGRAQDAELDTSPTDVTTY